MSAEPTADNQQLLGLFSQFALLGCKGGKITAEIMYKYIDTHYFCIDDSYFYSSSTLRSYIYG